MWNRWEETGKELSDFQDGMDEQLHEQLTMYQAGNLSNTLAVLVLFPGASRQQYQVLLRADAVGKRD